MNEKKTYSCSYSAQENKEIKKIRDKYTEPNEKEAKLSQLRKLDASVHNKAMALSLSVGIIGSLVLGFGMSCILVFDWIIAGIFSGIIGAAIMVLAYPLYKTHFEKLRKKAAPLILKLTDELLK